jgi:hypothetical protein
MNKGLQRTTGTKGLRFPVELSQIKSLESRVTFIIESEDKFFMAWIEEQVFCRDNI